MTDFAIAEVPGIRGSELTTEIAERLPAQAPVAPWRLRASGLVWVTRAPRGTGAALQRGITGRPLAVGGMFVSYEETPVGPFDEIIGLVGLRQGWSVAAHIPFIAVDSAASVVGGRATWALPKTPATFAGHPVRERAMRARHDEFEVTAQARAVGPALMARSRFTLVQAAAQGHEGRARG